VRQRGRRLPPSTLFPYTTLFRSVLPPTGAGVRVRGPGTRAAGGGDGRAAAVRGAGAICGSARAAGRGRPAGRTEPPGRGGGPARSEEHTSELQSLRHLVCRLLLE